MVTNFLSGKIASIKPENMLPYVERRLAEWADWYSRGNLFGLGYPPCSIEYRLMREGIVRTSPSGQRPLPVNEQAEEIERLVHVLSCQRPTLAEALREYYFRGGSLRAHAKAQGTSHTQLQRHVQQARYWLAGWLTARWENVRKKNREKG
jgi:hypothetical protein